jgi:hypothetical protein
MEGLARCLRAQMVYRPPGPLDPQDVALGVRPRHARSAALREVARTTACSASRIACGPQVVPKLRHKAEDQLLRVSTWFSVGRGLVTLDLMEQRHTTSGEQTRALLAEHGIHVTEDGVARTRAELREADARMTPEKWQELPDFIDAASL